MDAGQTNYIGLLNEYAQTKGWSVHFDVVQTTGPEHTKTFTIRAVMNNEVYPNGVGQNEEEARQNAARNALNSLENDNEPVNTESNLDSPDSFSNETQASLIQSESVLTSSSLFLEKFDSITKIGRGAFGRVFSARQKHEDRYFAVKIVKYNSKAGREVTTLSRLEHANIVCYHAAWTEDSVGSSYTQWSPFFGSGSEFLHIQMELCEGKTLCEWIEERNDHPCIYPKRRQDATLIIKQVLEAVKYIHSMKLIHRDLKPANIMFGHEGVVKVGDFGLITEEAEEDDGHLLERTKGAGTHSYMSPEQREQPTYGRKVDIFPVGLIYFELLWHIGTQSEKQKIWDDIRSKKFPEQFCEMFEFEHKLIERMLCENPERRPEASDLLTELAQHSATTASTEHNVHKENRTY